MKKTCFFAIIMLGGITISMAQAINSNPKSLLKDLHKLWSQEEIALQEIELPDSLHHNVLLDQGTIYCAKTNDAYLGIVYVGRIHSCRSGGCGVNDPSLELVPINDDFEYFDYFIILDEHLSVKKIRVYNYQATHGHEVVSRGWLKQFIGYDGKEKLEYGKNIDAISGATISANAITDNIRESVQFLESIKPILDQHQHELKAFAK